MPGEEQRERERGHIRNSYSVYTIIVYVQRNYFGFLFVQIKEKKECRFISNNN